MINRALSRATEGGYSISPRLTMEHSPVVIVGAGPSGLMLGLSLAKHGVYVRLILLITPLSQS